MTSSDSSLPYVPGLDGLRGVAVAAVVVYHVWPGLLPGGFLGVDVFFVLSGSLLSALLLHAVARDGSIGFWSFLSARMRRLLPALLLVLVAVAAIAGTTLSQLEATRVRSHAIAGAFYVANWRFVLDGTTYTDIVAGASPLRHLWSLSIEEQFYVVLAVAFAVLLRWSGREIERLRRGVVVVAVVAALASATAMVVGWANGASTSRLYFGTDTRAQAMLIGVVVGAVLMGRPPSVSRQRAATAASLLGAAVLVVLGLTARETSWWMYTGGFTIAALAAAAVIGGMQVSPLRAVLERRSLVGLGRISYGVYLWHWPVLVLATGERVGLGGFPLRVAQLAITLLLSVVSFRLVEQPIRHGALGRRLGAGALVVGPASVVAVLAFTAWVTSPRPVPDPSPEVAVAVAVEAPDPRQDRDQPTTVPAADGPAADGPALDGPAPRRVVVLGDSVAHSIAGGTVGAFPEFAAWDPSQSPFDPAVIDLVSIARPACSFLPGEVASFQPDGSYVPVSLSDFCEGWSEDLDALLAGDDRPVDDLLVVLSNDVMDREVDGELVRFRSAAHDELLTEFFDGVAERLGPDRRLVVVTPSIRVPDPNPDAGWREPALAEFARGYAADREGVLVIDLGPVVCPDDVCLDWRHDGLHFTETGARSVAAAITRQLLARHD